MRVEPVGPPHRLFLIEDSNVTYMKDLDEHNTQDLLEELERRRALRAQGKCDYCGRVLHSLPACRFVERHIRSGFSECPEFAGYTVSWRGQVARAGGYLMTQSPDSNGYPSVKLIVNGRRKRIAVHRLVAAAFLPSKPPGMNLIRHLDGNPLNSCATNLAWGDPATNAEDRGKHGRNRTITPEQQERMIAARRAKLANGK